MPIFDCTEAELRRRRSLKWQTYPPEVLPLWVAEMDVRMHPAVREVLTQALTDSDTGYPAGDGYQQAFAQMADARWGWEVDPVTQVQRSGDVMNGLLAVLLGNTAPGDSVVINTPIYPPFRLVVSGYGRRLIASPLVDDRLDLTGLAEIFATERPSAYLLCSPHNPNGTVHTAAELTRVAELAQQYGVLVIVDEIHGPLVAPQVPYVPYLSLPAAQGGVVVTSAGKAWNLAGFKAGLIIRGTENPGFWDRLPPLAVQASGHWGVLAHTAALTHAQPWLDEVNAEIVTHKELLAELLAEKLPLARYQPSAGTYLAWVDFSAYGLGDAGRHFLEYGQVAFGMGRDFDPAATDWVRINLATNPVIIEEAIRRAASSL